MPEPVVVAKLSDLPPGEMIRVYVDGRPIALFNVDGVVYATSDECSHDVASLSHGYLEGHIVTCPRHFAKFDVRTGKNLCFPAVTPVKSYPVTIVGDEVAVDVS